MQQDRLTTVCYVLYLMSNLTTRVRNIMFFYSDTEKSSFKGSFNASKYDPNDMICKHLENYFFLKFILLKSEDRIEKHQASKELDICERKMNFWKKQSSFCSVRYQKDIKNHNNMYEMS